MSRISRMIVKNLITFLHLSHVSTYQQSTTQQDRYHKDSCSKDIIKLSHYQIAIRVLSLEYQTSNLKHSCSHDYAIVLHVMQDHL